MRKMDFKEYVFKPEQILTSFDQPAAYANTTDEDITDFGLVVEPKLNIEAQLQN